MNQETKDQINAKYERELQRGEHFWPDSIYKDAIVALGIFILLILLATFVGVHELPKADPTDTSYIPRPEWYFLFLFKFLALYGQIPLIGTIEWIGTAIIPGIAVAILTLLPFIDKSPHRYYAKRALPLAIMTIMIVGIVLLTILADVPAVTADGSTTIGLLQGMAGIFIPALAYIVLVVMAYTLKEKAARAITWATGITALLMISFTGISLALHTPVERESVEIPHALADQISAGQDLYSLHCVECHGDDGKVDVILGVAGLEGVVVSIINSPDVLYTINDPSMVELIAYGRPNFGMPPLGLAYNPKGLTRNEIELIVTFMRYAWDDRYEAPYIPPLYPPLAEGEIPTYATHIQPIVKRYCLSCHRPGKDSGAYFMDTYENILKSGDNADKNVIAGDMNSYLIQTIEHKPILDAEGRTLINEMPPSRKMSQDIIDIFILWVMNDMPK